MQTDKPFFHELRPETQKMILEGKVWPLKTYGNLKQIYNAPAWCGYGQEALEGIIMGCWSLMSQRVTGEDFCKSCDLYEPVEQNA